MQDTASLVELDYDIMHIYLQGLRLICACREPRLAVFEQISRSQIREAAVYPDPSMRTAAQSRCVVML